MPFEPVITPALQTALEDMRHTIREHGLHKLASNLLGIDVSQDRDVLVYLGTKLAAQRLENRRIAQGLAALKALVR